MKPIYQRHIPDAYKKHFEKEMFNKRFGHLRVIGVSNETDSTNVHFVICICDCGRVFSCRKRNVQIGRTKSCCNYKSIEEERDRFKEKILIDEHGCWIWKHNCYKRTNGKKSYGRHETKLFPEEYLAHRIAFCLFKGNIPKKMNICHLCDIENCVNPDHLFLGSNQTNVFDKMVKGKGSEGIKNHNAKYTDEIVLKARALYKTGLKSKAISEQMNIPKSTIDKFIFRKSWKHLP